MNRSARWVIIAAVLALFSFVVWSSFARVGYECELCVDFAGQTKCTRGGGATEQEARQGAQTAACGQMANGMSEVIACQNTPPRTAQCRTT